MAEDIYQKLQGERIEAILDDRDERAGVKFKDSDLVGFPLKVVIGEKSLAENKLEIQIRKTKEKRLVGLSQALAEIVKLLTDL